MLGSSRERFEPTQKSELSAVGVVAVLGLQRVVERKWRGRVADAFGNRDTGSSQARPRRGHQQGFWRIADSAGEIGQAGLDQIPSGQMRIVRHRSGRYP